MNGLMYFSIKVALFGESSGGSCGAGSVHDNRC